MPLLNYQTPPKVKKKEDDPLSFKHFVAGLREQRGQPDTGPANVARQAIDEARAARTPEEAPGTGTVIWEGIKSLPREIAAKALTGIEGIAGAEVAEPDWADKFIAKTERLREERFRKYDMGREVFPGFNVGDLAQLPSNLAYSISTLIPAVGAGVTAGIFTGGIGGWAAGAGVGGTAAYRMASGEIMRSYLKEMNLKKMQESGRGLTKGEEGKLKADFDNKAQSYGAWEAIPEAIGGVGAGKIIANTVLGSAIKKAVGKELATKLLARAFGVYGSELTQEMVTEFGQRGVLAGTPVAQGEPLDPTKPSDYWQAFKDVAPQTFLITSILGPVGAGTAKAHERFIQDPRSRDRVKAAVVEDKYKDFDGPTLTGFAQLTTKVAERYPEDADLQGAVGAIRKEFASRVQGRFEGAHLTPEEGGRLAELAKTNPWMAGMGITEDTINKAIEGTWIDPDAQTQAPSVEPDQPETLEEVSDKQRGVIEQRVRTKMGDAEELTPENFEEVVRQFYPGDRAIAQYARQYAGQILADGTFGLNEDMRGAVDTKVAELGSKQNVSSLYKGKGLIGHYARWKADQLGLPEKGVAMPGKKKGKKGEPTVPIVEPTEKSEITSRLIDAFKGPSDTRVTRLTPILEEATDEEMATALKELGEMPTEEKEASGALMLNSVIEKYYTGKLEPKEEGVEGAPAFEVGQTVTIPHGDTRIKGEIVGIDDEHIRIHPEGTDRGVINAYKADVVEAFVEEEVAEEVKPVRRIQAFTYKDYKGEKDLTAKSYLEYKDYKIVKEFKGAYNIVDESGQTVSVYGSPRAAAEAIDEGKIGKPELEPEKPTKIEIPEGVKLTPEEQDVVDTVEIGRAMDIDLFHEEGIKGEMHKATGEEAPYEIGSLETPISHGLSEGYPIQDIAHFYIATRMAKEDKADWTEKAKDDTWLDANIDRIETAFEEFQEDLEKEFESLELGEAPQVSGPFPVEGEPKKIPTAEEVLAMSYVTDVYDAVYPGNDERLLEPLRQLAKELGVKNTAKRQLSQLTDDITGAYNLLHGKGLPPDIGPPRKITPEPKAEEPKAEKPIEDFPIPVSYGDIPLELATAAHAGTSHTPERRALGRQRDYVFYMRKTYNALRKYAKTDEQKAILKEELQRYKEGLLKRYTALLHAESRLISTMITGPAKFPVQQQKKRGATADKRRGELIEWDKKALKAMKKKLGVGPRVISSDAVDAVEQLEKKIADAERLQQTMKAANAIVKMKHLSDAEKVEKLKALEGMPSSHAHKILQPDYMGRIGFAAYALKNNNANIRRMKKRIEELKSSRAQETKEFEFEGGKIIDNVEDNRVQIAFDEKPSDDIRKQLKFRAFRWAPSIEVWQRKRSPEALRIARSFFAAEEVKPEKPAEPKAPKMAVIEDHEGIMVEIPKEQLAQAAGNLLEELENRAIALKGTGTKKEIGAAIRARGGLKWDSMVKDYGENITNRLAAILGIGSIKKSGKIMPDEVAADFDFETEGDLVDFLLEGRTSVPKYTKTLLRHIAKTGEARGPKGGTTGLAVFARDLERHAKLLQEEVDYYDELQEKELAEKVPEKATEEVPEDWTPEGDRWTVETKAEFTYHLLDFVDDGSPEGQYSAMIVPILDRFDYYPGGKDSKIEPVTYDTLQEALYAAEQDSRPPPPEEGAPEERKYTEENLKQRIGLDKEFLAKHGKEEAETYRDRQITRLLTLPDAEIEKAIKGNLSTFEQQWEEDKQRKERHGGRKQGDLFGKDVSTPQTDLFRPDPYREADVPVHVNQRKLAQLDRMIETKTAEYQRIKEDEGDIERANMLALTIKGLTTVRKFYMANKPIPENWQDEFGVGFLYDKFMAREKGPRVFPEYKGRKATDAAIDGAYLLIEPEEYDFWLGKVTEEVGEENAKRIDKEARRLYDTWTKKTDGILDKVVEFFNAGLGNLGWYKRSQEYIEEAYGEDADIFSQFLAITSAGMKTTTNVTLAKNAYRQWKKGDTEFKNFRHAMRVNLQKAVQGLPWYDELHRPGRPGQIEPVFRKTGNFYKALRGDPDAVTVDIWVRRAFGYDMEKRLSAADYDFMESAIRNLATKWGVTPRDVQESIWMGAKLKEEGAAADIRGYEDLLAVHGVRMLREMKPGERLADIETFRQQYPTSNIRIDDQGRLLIDYETNEGTKTLLVEWVDEIAENAEGLHLGWGQKELTEDQIIAGRYNRSHIQLVLNESNEFDASHEVYHSFEDLFMTSKDVAVMRGTAKRWIRNGKLTAAKKGSEGNHEDRANLYATLWNAPEPNTAAGKIIEKMRDFLHMIANAVGLRTARGIVGDAKAGVLQQSLSGVGISPESHFIRSKTKKAPDTSVLDHILPESVRERFKAAKGLGQFDLKLRHRIKQTAIEAGTAFIPGREYVVLNPKYFGKAIEILRHYREVPRWAKEKSRDIILEIVSPGNLTPQDYDLFRTKLFLEDILHDMEENRPLENWKELVELHGEIAFGFKNREEVEIALAKANEMVGNNQKVKQALSRRESRRKWIVGQIVENGLLPKAAVKSPHYVHHQVLAFAEMRQRVSTYTKGMRPEVPKRGYQIHRTGSVKDYNTEYVESEFEWMAHALAQIEAIKDHKDMVAQYDIKKSLARKAKGQNLKQFYQIVYDPEKATLDEEGGIVDPLQPFRKTIARSMDRLGKWAAEGKLIAEGELEYVVEELSESWQQRQADKKDYEEEPEMWTKVSAEKTPFFQYLSWLVANGHPGSRPAANILKAIRNRNKTIETTIRDNNKEFETAYTMMKKEAPIEGSQGYDIHLPKPGTAWFKAFSIHEKLYERFIEGALGRQLTEGDFREVLARGKDMELIVPIEVKSAMENVYGAATPGETTIGNMAEQSLNWWKRYILLNPFRVIKYNVNNMSGDFDIAVAYDPGIMKYAIQAGKDLVKWHRRHLPGAKMEGPLYTELEVALRHGVIGSGMTVHDIPDIGRGTGLEKIHKAIDGKKPHMVKRYWNTVKAFSTWRENVLRLAAYRRFQDRLAKGENLYGASNKEKVDATTDLDRKAALLARELIGDYGAISEGGQWLRRKMIPFYSWMEINAPRYVRMMRNLPHEGQKKGQQVAMMSLVGAKKAAALSIKASILFAAVQMWNQLMFPDEEDELGEMGRRQLHIILPPGRREDGTINTLRFQGALSDAMAWFGAEDAPQDVRELVERRKTVWDFMAEAPVEFVNKLYQGVRPDIKVPMELATGRATWPDLGRGQPIRDRMEHVIRTFSLDPVYRRLIGRPLRGGSPEGRLMQDLMNIVTYTADPGEIAYHSVRRWTNEFAEDNNAEKPMVTPTSRGNALYRYKQALKYGDADAALKYMRKYKEMGGTPQGIKISIKLAHPIGGLQVRFRGKFRRSLSPEQQISYDRAVRWYRDTYLKRRRQ